MRWRRVDQASGWALAKPVALTSLPVAQVPVDQAIGPHPRVTRFCPVGSELVRLLLASISVSSRPRAALTTPLASAGLAVTKCHGEPSSQPLDRLYPKRAFQNSLTLLLYSGDRFGAVARVAIVSAG